MRWWDSNSNLQIWCMQYLGFSRWCWWWFKSSGIWWFVVGLTHPQTGVLDLGHEGGTVLQSVEHATVSHPRRHASSVLWWSKLGCGERQAFKWRQAPDIFPMPLNRLWAHWKSNFSVVPISFTGTETWRTVLLSNCESHSYRQVPCCCPV